ncbi:MAG: dCTP deaminase [Dehalococcoidia bacterium]
MVLSDRSIREAIEAGTIKIEPYSDRDVQPASVDFHLANTILVFRNSTLPYIDLRKDVPNLTEEVEITEEVPFMLHPGEFVLGSTLEKLTLPNDIVARIEGKSSLGRLGLMIHSTAGFIDPGWTGNLTLELANVSRLPITLYFGMRIGQISFQQMTTEVERPYGSKELSSRYQGQEVPTASRAHLDFDSHIKRS